MKAKVVYTFKKDFIDLMLKDNDLTTAEDLKKYLAEKVIGKDMQNSTRLIFDWDVIVEEDEKPKTECSDVRNDILAIQNVLLKGNYDWHMSYDPDDKVYFFYIGGVDKNELS